MPTNITYEYSLAEKRFHEATIITEKISALQEMLRTCPTHKGCERLRSQLKQRLAKLKKEQIAEKKSRGKSKTIKKEGAGQVVFLGVPNSGKSYLLSKLSKTKIKVADYPFTTKNPVVRMIPCKNTWMQGIEIPAMYPGFSETQKSKQVLSLVRNSDLIVLVLDGSKNIMAQVDLIVAELKNAGIKLVKIGKKYENFVMSVPVVLVCVRKKCVMNYKLDSIYFDESKISDIIGVLWKHLSKIAVQTKTKGKGIAKKPIILEKGATVQEVVGKVHKDFLKKFKYAKIWGNSAAFPGQACGFDHKLKDGDIIEIFVK